MRKIGGNSWLNAVKKAFRSPTKDNEKRSSRRREENEQEEEKVTNTNNLAPKKYFCVLFAVMKIVVGFCRREERGDFSPVNLWFRRRRYSTMKRRT